MLRILLSLLFLFSFSGSLLAQASADAPKKRGFDCSQAKDPKACEERVAKLKAAREKARKACEGKQGDEARECMRREMCAQSKDPARCEAAWKAQVAQREKIREACKDKQGEALKSCIREQRQKK